MKKKTAHSLTSAWLHGENEVSEAMDSCVMPLLSVALRSLGVEPGLGASSEAAFGVSAGSERGSHGLDALASELRTSFDEEGASAVGHPRRAGMALKRGGAGWRLHNQRRVLECGVRVRNLCVNPVTGNSLHTVRMARRQSRSF